MADIFERLIGNRDKDDQVFIKLTSSKDSPLAYVIPLEINIEESFSTGSFMVIMTVFDGTGSLMHYRIPEYDTDFTFYFGSGYDSSGVTMSLKMARLEQMDAVIGKSESVTYRITFVHSGWYELSGKIRNRGWHDKLYSDIVTELAGECGYSKLDVYPTLGEKEHIGQPHLTNIEMFNWLAKRSKHPQYDDSFQFGVNVKGEFFFKTVSDWLDEQRGEAESGSCPVLTLQGVHQNDGTRSSLKAANGMVPPHFFQFENREHYFQAVRHNGSQIRSSYYDFEEAEYKHEDFTYDQLKAWMLTDWGPQKTIHHDSSKIRQYYGSDVDSFDMSKASLTNTINSENSFGITTEGTHRVNIGRVIELIIPTDMSHPMVSSPVSEFFSGFYLVTAVRHRFQMDQNRYYTDFTLLRHGYDGKSLGGYIKSSLGRFVGRKSSL